MAKVMATGSRVQGDVLRFLRGSGLAATVRGGVYRSGYRPANSGEEDIVVTFTAGLPGEVESGAVTLSIYVPDIATDGGRRVADGARCAELEEAAAAWVASLTCARCAGYKFWLQSAIRTEGVEGIAQHLVVVKLGYELYE